MENIKEYLGQRIQEIRKRRGLKQAELAELLDIDSKHMSKIECGRSYPSFELLDKISKVLNTTAATLLDTEHLCPREVLLGKIHDLLQNAPEDAVRRAYKILKEIL